jgi:hypothetical protein
LAQETPIEPPGLSELHHIDSGPLEELRERCKSPALRTKVTRNLSDLRARAILHDIRGGELQKEVLEQIKNETVAAVRASERSEGLTLRMAPPRVVISERLKIVCVTYSFAGHEVTPSFRKDRLWIRFFVCPDLDTASLFAWFRRGNELPPIAPGDKQLPVESHDLGLFYFDELRYGEIAYGICPDYEAPRLREESDPLSFQTRGFLRRNIVVEASTRILQKEGESWKAGGPDAESWSHIDSILTALDAWLQKPGG